MILGDRADSGFFQRVLEAIPDFVLVKGPRSRLVWANRAFREYYGLTEAQLESIVDGEQSDPDDTVQYVRDDHHVFTTGTALRVAEPITRHDGAVAYFDTIKTRIDVEGVPTHTVGVSRPAREDHPAADHSARVRSERKQRLDVLRQVMAGVPAAIVLVDERYRIVSATDRAIALLGPLTPGHFLDEVVAMPAPIAVIDGEHDWCDGRILRVERRPWTLPDPNRPDTEQQGGALLLFEDVTELRANERALQALNEQLEEYAFVAAHDLREPLRMVSNLLGLLELDYGATLDETARSYIEMATTGARRMQQMVADLLDVARTRANRERHAPVRLLSIASEVHDAYLGAAAARGVSLLIDVPDVDVVGDPAQLHQLLANLVSNGIRFARRDASPSPWVRVSARVDGAQVEVQVEDNGIGMDPRFVDKAFQLFQRLDPDRDHDTGTGIGLAIVRRVAQGHGSPVQVESTPGQGTLFRIHLPRSTPTESS